MKKVEHDHTLPDMVIGKLPSANITGPENKTFLGRWIELGKYLSNPVDLHLKLAGVNKLNHPFVSVVDKGDASMVMGISRDAMRDLCLNESDHWLRPKFGPLKFTPDTKHEFASQSLSTNNGEAWKQRRAVVNSSFRSNVAVEIFTSKMRSNMESVLEQLRVREGKPVSMLHLSRQIALKNVATILFGIPEIPKNVEKAFDGFLSNVMSPLTIALQHDVWPLPYHTIVKSLQGLFDWAAALIKEKRKNPDDSVASMMANRLDESTGDFQPVEKLVGDLIVLYITGRDGPSSTVAWTLFLLAAHPYVQQRVLDGLQATGTSEYLDCVISESLRIIPGAFILNPRLCSRDGIYAGVHIPPGATVLGSILARHHDPEVWSNPRHFNPERWRGPDFKKPDPFDYCPFGQGERRCVGDAFAMKQLKETIEAILKVFRVEVVANATYNYKASAITIDPHRKNALLFKPHQKRTFPWERPLVRGNISKLVDLTIRTQETGLFPKPPPTTK